MPASTENQSEGSTQTKTLTLLEKIIQNGQIVHDDSQTVYAQDLIAEFASQVLEKSLAVAKGEDPDTRALINDRISQIDKLIGDQLNEIIHDEAFQKLEASWRGLHLLVSGTETSSRLKLRLLNVSQKELTKDLTRSVDLDQTVLFKKIYEEEYGTFGGYPVSYTHLTLPTKRIV